VVIKDRAKQIFRNLYTGSNPISHFMKPYAFFSNDSLAAEYFMQYIYSLIVKNGDTVIDVGANHGFHTLPLSGIAGKEGRVLAFEAVSSNIDDIKSKMTIDNVIFYNMAVTKPDIAERCREIKFHYFPNKDGFSGIARRPDISDEQEELISVPTTTLDQIVMKIDNGIGGG
jgi:FkbM family methyltransferase